MQLFRSLLFSTSIISLRRLPPKAPGKMFKYGEAALIQIKGAKLPWIFLQNFFGRASRRVFDTKLKSFFAVGPNSEISDSASVEL